MQKVKSSLEEKSDEYVGLLAALNNTSLNRPPQAFSGLCSSLSFSPSSQGFIGTCTPIAVSACPLARLTRQVWNVPRTLGDSDRAFTRKKKVRLEGNNWPDPTVSQPKLFSFSLYKMQSSFQGLASQRNYAFFLSRMYFPFLIFIFVIYVCIFFFLKMTQHLEIICFRLLLHTYSVVQLCPTLSDPTDCSPPGSFVHGIFQASILE